MAVAPRTNRYGSTNRRWIADAVAGLLVIEYRVVLSLSIVPMTVYVHLKSIVSMEIRWTCDVIAYSPALLAGPSCHRSPSSKRTFSWRPTTLMADSQPRRFIVMVETCGNLAVFPWSSVTPVVGSGARWSTDASVRGHAQHLIAEGFRVATRPRHPGAQRLERAMLPPVRIDEYACATEGLGRSSTVPTARFNSLVDRGAAQGWGRVMEGLARRRGGCRCRDR
jgi:hypothetical protein